MWWVFWIQIPLGLSAILLRVKFSVCLFSVSSAAYAYMKYSYLRQKFLNVLTYDFVKHR